MPKRKQKRLPGLLSSLLTRVMVSPLSGVLLDYCAWIFHPMPSHILPLCLPRLTLLRSGPPPRHFLVPIWLIPLLPRLSSLQWKMCPYLRLTLAPGQLHPQGKLDGYKQYAGSWHYPSAM